jgi:hypothetical protein
MRSFEEALKVEYGKDVHDLGGDASQSMHKALERIRKENLRTFKIYSGLVLLLLLLLIILVALYVHKPHEMAIAAAAVGLSLWKPFDIVLKAWEGWRKSELMMVLIEGANSSEIQAMFDKIVEKY